MDSCETARYSLFRSQPNRVQFARLRAAPSILHINGTPGTGRLLSPEYNDQNITNGGSPCSSSVHSFNNPRNIHFAYGPGETGYVLQLQAYDQAFQKFFDRLAADGIDKS